MINQNEHLVGSGMEIIMIKKKLFKYGSVFMCAALMACSLAACSTNSSKVEIATAVSVGASNDSESILQNALTDTLNAASDTKANNVSTEKKTNSKDETVYVFTDVTGKQDHVIVNEKLNNVTGASTIQDFSKLSNIKNLTGDETSTTGSDNKLTWAADGNSITYQGTTTQQTPVTIKVTYYLDGKEISADKLAGQSGKVKIRFDYTNNEKKTITVNGKEQIAYVPFTVLTGMVLPKDTFSNIEVTNGKVTQVNDNNIVIGAAMPGLKDSLDLELGDETLDIDIPEYFEVTADANDFELNDVMSVATSSIFADVDVDSINIDDVKDQMDDLQDASNQLMDGTSTLADGTDTLKDGTSQLADGASQLVDGASQLADGTGELNSKVPTLTSGISQLADGAGQLANGTGELNSKVPTLTSGISQLASGASQLAAGTGELNGKVPTLTSGISQLASGASQLASGTGELNGKVPALTSGISQVDEGAGQLSTGLNQLFSKMPTLTSGISQLNDGSGQLADGTNKLNEGVMALKKGTSKLASDTEGLGALQSGVSAYTDGVSTANDGADTLKTGTQQVTDGLTTLAGSFAGDGTEANPGIVNGMESLESGAEQLDAGIGKLASTLNSSFEQINQQAQAYDNSSTLAQAQTIENNIGGAVNAMLAQLGNANLAITPYTDMNKTIDNATTQALYTKYMDAYQFVITNESNPIIAGINQTLAASGTQFTNLGAVYNAQMGLLFQTVSNQSISGALTQVYNTATQTQDPETGMNLSQSLATLKAGSSQLSNGISTVKAGIGTLDELTANTPLAAPTTVCQALNALISGSAQVNEGAGQLKAGLSKLTANNDTLNSGMSSAVEGAKQLDAGADQLTDANNGVPALVTGANQLKAGLGQLVFVIYLVYSLTYHFAYPLINY